MTAVTFYAIHPSSFWNAREAILIFPNRSSSEISSSKSNVMVPSTTGIFGDVEGSILTVG